MDEMKNSRATPRVALQPFNTLEEAVYDWAWNNFAVAEYTYFEHASVLYTTYDNGERKYAYTKARYNPATPGEVSYRLEEVPGGSENKAGIIHTHPLPENFSEQDNSVIDLLNVPGFLVINNPTFGVDIYKRNPGGKTELIKSAFNYYRLTESEKNKIRYDNYNGYKVAWANHLREANHDTKCQLNTVLKKQGSSCSKVGWPNKWVY